MSTEEELALAVQAPFDAVEAVLHSDTIRAEGFSDSVLSIIITLLVLDLFPLEYERGAFSTPCFSNGLRILHTARRTSMSVSSG